MTPQLDSLKTTLVIIPALNEEKTVGSVIRTLKALGLSQIRVVDNGSSDRTAQAATAAGAAVIHEPVRGYGQACWRGLQALPPEIEWILFCDADGSDALEQLPELLAQRSDHDFILGNRRGTAAGRQALTPVQNFGNWFASALIFLGWGHQYHDLGPLRLIRRSALEALQMQDRGFGWTVEMQAKAAEQGLQIAELPVTYRLRQGGRSKISGTVLGSLRAGTVILTTLADLYARNVANTLGPGSALAPTTEPASQSPPPRGQRPAWVNRCVLVLSTVCLILGSVWSVPHGDFLNDPAAVPQFWIAMGIMGLGFGLSWGLHSLTAVWFWGVAIATRLLLLGMFPSDDIWRYLWEGYIQTQGFSPYELAPDAAILTPLRTDWWGQINHPDVSAIYPPIAQFGFRLLAGLTPSVLLFKAAFTAADLAICWLLCQRFGYRATALYAWNPLVIYSFAGGGHYDSWFLLPIVAAWLWYERPYGRSLASPPPLHALGSALLLGVSVAIKWISLPILSFLAWQSLKQKQWRLTLGVALAGLLPFGLSAIPFCNLASCPLVPTESVFVNYGRSAEFIPHLVASVWEASRWENRLFAVPLMVAVVALLWRAPRFGQFAQAYLLALLTLSPIIHGWYFAWLMPFGVASRNLGVTLVSFSAFVYFALPHRVALGNTSWVLTNPERWALWLPLVVGLIASLFPYRFLRRGSASLRLM